MTAVPIRAPSKSRAWLIPGLVIAAMAAAVIFLRPNFGLLAPQSLAIKVHLAFAVVALGLGTAMMTSRKGARFHRIAGWIWAIMMLVVAGSSLFITSLTPGHWSWIHILSGWTLVAVPLGLLFARRHSVKNHRRFMAGTFFGGLLIAGAFTFVPGRLMWDMFFGGSHG